jgi:unsaturated rhamnogalacturonyl hydrolase
MQMLHLTYNREDVLGRIHAMVLKTMGMDMPWDWQCGVAYYGIAEAYKRTDREEYLTLLRERIDELIELGLPAWTVNTCAMGHCLITLYEATKEQKYWDIALSKVDYLRDKAARFAEGVLQHTVSAKNDFPEQAWADTLFMAAFFLLRMGVKMEDQEVIADALNQYFWHLEFLQDKSTGLWYHGYNHQNRDHMSGFYWARANAWAAYTMSQVRYYLPEAYLYPQFMDVSGSLREQLSALKRCQTENGLWRTVLNDEESYEELSASCGIAAAMMAADNPLYTKYVQRAYEGIIQNIGSDGRLQNVSGGTAVMRDLDGYRSITRRWMQGCGQGLGLTFLAALVETDSTVR